MGLGLSGLDPAGILLSTCGHGALEGRYLLQRRRGGEVRPLAVGSYAEVWPASDRFSGEQRAVKSISREKACRADIVSEVELLKECEHPNVVKFFEMIADFNEYHIILEYCAKCLRDLITAKPPPSEKFVATMADQVFGAIQFLHGKLIVHRDVKPANFLVKQQGREEVVKLADFGISARLEAKETLKESKGTPAYMPPEWHTLPAGPGYGLMADIWAAGVTLQEMINGGRNPFVDSEGRLQVHWINKARIDEPDFFSGWAPWRSAADGISLVRRMLMPHPKQRPTAQLARAHAWFASCGVENGHFTQESSAELNKDIGPKLVLLRPGAWANEDDVVGR